MPPVTFVHVDTGHRVLCRTPEARERFNDNRAPGHWFTVPATADDLRRL